MFYLAIILYVATDGMEARYWAPNGLDYWHIAATALFLHGWHPESITSVVPGGWSIAVEMTFYLLVPFLFRVLTSIPRALLFMGISSLLLAGANHLATSIYATHYSESQQYLVEYFGFLWFFSQLPVFALGILAYQVIKWRPGVSRRTAAGLYALAIMGAATVIVICSDEKFTGFHILFSLSLGLFSLAVYYWPHRIVVNKVMLWLGRISFSVYLFHFLVIKHLTPPFEKLFPEPSNIGFLVFFVAVTAASAGIATISYSHVELAGIRLGRRLSSTNRSSGA